ncbi:Rhodanese-like domain-containing protein [Stachybotrys elegans]|uniref:M-phase inducer phosphatase n=1 Tax=Stachybotrys elegans TaxID=80388 RepID=A0A8K0SCT3_9HYPO|nr:Rhodanese-like domain-containing protein [Stachybotrys elegans]
MSELDECYAYKLPHTNNEDDVFPRISLETMFNVMKGNYRGNYDRSIIVDCRFDYEYKGGHIDGAVNFSHEELIISHLFSAPAVGCTLLIFHCEYSKLRAPTMAYHIRAKDRNENSGQYPKLSFPEMYILDGGYSAFFNQHLDSCTPRGYVGMDAEEYTAVRDLELARIRRAIKGRSYHLLEASAGASSQRR